MSLPALSGMANNIRINGTEAPSSLPAAPVLPETWQPRFAAPPASSSGAGDSSKSMLFSSLRCVGEGCGGHCRDGVAERVSEVAVRLMSFHGEILSCVSCHSIGRSVMCLMSLHGEICHVFHVIPWGDLSCVSCHSMVRSVVSHVIPWGDLSRISCHSMGRSVSFHYMGRSVMFHSMERSAVMCVMSFHGEICHASHVIPW